MPKASEIVFAITLLAMDPHATRGQVTQPKVVKADHVAFYVSDLRASVAFYHDTFGFSEVPIPFKIPLSAAWLQMGEGVMLHLVAGRKEPVTNSRWDHLAVGCESMDAMIAWLDARHVSWTDMGGKHEPQVRPDGVKQIFVRDPDGYWVEINDALKGK